MMENNPYNIIDINSNNNDINEISEPNEYQKMSEYYSKINQYRNNHYRKCYEKGTFCDFYFNGEWVEGYIADLNEDYLVIMPLYQFYVLSDDSKYQVSYSDRVAYFRKHTKPSLTNISQVRGKKEILLKKIKGLLNPEHKNIFKDDNINKEEKIFDKIFYYLHSTLYNSIDYCMGKSKEKNSLVEEGFRIIVLVLEYLSEFYHYINVNFDDFLNYKNNIADSELADIVIFDKKYAIFSFWDDANILMEKIFANNVEYIDWFVDSDKILQKIVPSSQNFKKITNNEKLLCPLYDYQAVVFKNQSYNYTLRNGSKLTLKKICTEESYKNNAVMETKGYHVHSFILCYLIDYFYALGGYKDLFSLCRENCNIKFATVIFDNIIYGCSFTNAFKGIYEQEKNGISKMLFTFINSINEQTIKTNTRNDIMNFLRKGSYLFPNLTEKSSIFEELYLIFIIKKLILAKKKTKILESIDEINNILYSIDYYQLLNEKKNINNNGNLKDNKQIDELLNSPKFELRDKLIHDISYKTFYMNCKNYNIIEKLFTPQNNNTINEEIIIRFAPILFVMYKNNFGFSSFEKSSEILQIKKLVFDGILNKLRESERESIIVFKQIFHTIIDFCEILTDEDKSNVFGEIKNIFYNSFFNQNFTLETIFSFIIRFSSIAVKKTNIYNSENNEKNYKDINKVNINININSISDNMDCNTCRPIEEICDTSNLQFDEKKYYGLELVYNFMTNEQYEQVKFNDKKLKEYKSAAIDGIIEIISNIKSPKNAINIILYKIYNAIKKQKDVIQHLLLFQKLLGYSRIDDFSSEFGICLKEFLGKIDLIQVLLNELYSFLNNLNQNQNQNQIIDINEINTNSNNIGNDSQNEQDNNENIKIRIKTIFIAVLRNNKDFNILKEFFIRMIQFNEFTKNTLYHYLNRYLNEYSIDFIKYLYKDIISQKTIFKIESFETYQICKNIIIQINKKENILFIMNNQDIGVVLNEKEMKKEITGMELFWDLLINNEQNISTSIINDLTDFICNLLFGLRIKDCTNIYKSYENYWTNLILSISDKLQKCIEEKNNNKNIKGIKSLILLIQKIIHKAKNINGEIIKNLKEINKESTKLLRNKNNFPEKEYNYIGNKGNDNFYMLDIKVNNGDLFYMLRYELSYLYNIPVNQVGIKAHLNILGKNKKITQKDMDKLYKNNNYRDFNILYDFINIYEQFNTLNDFYNSKGKKKYPLLIEVKMINNIWNDIYKFNPIDIIYKKSQLPITLMNLLKGPEAPYTFDVLNLVKGNGGDNDFSAISNEIEKIINSNKNTNTPGKDDLFDFENTSIYYISYIISILNNVIKKNNNNNNFIYKFLNSHVWNNVRNLNIINDDSNKNKKLPFLSELYEKYNLINNLVDIYLIIAENVSKNDKNLTLFIICKIIKIYNYIINESMNINLNKCGKSEGITIDKVKNVFFESLGNINNLITKNEKIMNYIIKSLVNNENNDDMKIIKNIFEYIMFESIIKNKYKAINKKIKSLIIELVKLAKPIPNVKLFQTNEVHKENLYFYYYLLEFYLGEKSFYKMMNIFQDINNNNKVINNFKYEYNTKILFDIIAEVLLNIYEYVKDKFNVDAFLLKVLMPKANNIYIPNIPLHSIFHQLILGGVFKLISTILLMPNNKTNCLSYNQKKELIEYLYNSIIMSKCNENILKPKNINNENNSVAISSSFCVKEASNLFILFLFKENNNEDIYNSYITKLTDIHKLCYWKGYNLSDWKLYFKENQKLTPYVGLKNLGCTCYINSLLQTFFHISLLRESILNCQQETSTEKNCFYQLKKVFYSLKYLQTTYYTPTSFIENYDNQKLDAKVQMDVFEFFCDFIEKIEQKLKNTKNENIIKYFFMGRQNDVLTFEGECNHHRTNESQFYSIQLQVQGKKNIYESLDTLIEGEKMTGDNCIFCPQCNKNMPSTKSQNFKTLPRIFMFVLKRFEFNYQTMQKFKINDYYEFPIELDMNKYTDDFIRNGKNDDNRYKLKSIIVHTGNCDSGHYYAFILDEKTNEWYEFNDTKVQKFHLDALDVEAYGKGEIISENGNNIEVESNKSAYILFYEKINKNNCEHFDKIDIIYELLGIKKENKNEINEIDINKDEEDDFNLLNNNNNNNNNCININETNEINTNLNKNNKIKKEELIQKILEPINKEMYRYFLNQRIFSEEYHHFILSLFVNMLNKYNQPQKIEFPQILSSNNDSSFLQNEIKNFKNNRANKEISNLDNYINKKKIYIFDSKQVIDINETETTSSSEDKEKKILELFKNLIIYFFNVMIRAREKNYLGPTVNLVKFLINRYSFCADYFIEECSNINFLIEYMINCPSYETKKLIVGIIYCAMIKCVKLYEEKEIERIRQENLKNEMNNKQNANEKKSNKKESKNKKNNKEKEEKNKEEQMMSDEEYARKLQEEFNRGSGGESYNNDYNGESYNNDNNNNNDYENNNTNPLDRKFIPVNVLKLIYNTLHAIKGISFKNKNESRFLYLILYRFSLITKKTKKFLINKAFVLELLNILLLSEVKGEYHDEEEIIKSIDKGSYTSPHDILCTEKKEIDARYDKGGAFHYENYINTLYLQLLSHEQKPKAKHPYFEGSYNFENKTFIKALFFLLNTKQNAYIFSKLISIRCNNAKNYKKRIERVLANLLNILNKADNNEKINYDINDNRDVFNNAVYNENKMSNNLNMLEDEDYYPKVDPKLLLLILKRFIITMDNKKIDEFRITTIFKFIFQIIERNSKYYNYTIMLIDFIIELFTNNMNVMSPYVNNISQQLKYLIQWLKNNPISPELYPIDGISMYKDDNVAYRSNITDEEKLKFNEEQKKKTEKRIQKLTNILELKVKDYDYDYEADFDLSDFKFRKGDYVYYKKDKAVIKEFLDELILIKIIERDKDSGNNNNNDIENDDGKNYLSNLEKIQFWIAKDDKNLSIYNLE